MTQTRTESQKMDQKGSQAAGGLERDRDRTKDHAGGGSQNRGGK